MNFHLYCFSLLCFCFLFCHQSFTFFLPCLLFCSAVSFYYRERRMRREGEISRTSTHQPPKPTCFPVSAAMTLMVATDRNINKQQTDLHTPLKLKKKIVTCFLFSFLSFRLRQRQEKEGKKETKNKKKKKKRHTLNIFQIIKSVNSLNK